MSKVIIDFSYEQILECFNELSYKMFYYQFQDDHAFDYDLCGILPHVSNNLVIIKNVKDIEIRRKFYDKFYISEKSRSIIEKICVIVFEKYYEMSGTKNVDEVIFKRYKIGSNKNDYIEIRGTLDHSESPLVNFKSIIIYNSKPQIISKGY